MNKERHPQYDPSYSLNRKAALMYMVFVSVFIWKYYLQIERKRFAQSLKKIEKAWKL